MEKLDPAVRVGQQGDEVDHFRADLPHGVGHEGVAHGVLHPAVGQQDPQGGEVRADSATIQMDRACTFFETRFQPKIQTPMNVDSRKNATVASMASGAPKMSPT